MFYAASVDDKKHSKKHQSSWPPNLSGAWLQIIFTTATTIFQLILMGNWHHILNFQFILQYYSIYAWTNFLKKKIKIIENIVMWGNVLVIWHPLGFSNGRLCYQQVQQPTSSTKNPKSSSSPETLNWVKVKSGSSQVQLPRLKALNFRPLSVRQEVK